MKQRLIPLSEITDEYLEQVAIGAPKTASGLRSCRDMGIPAYEIICADGFTEADMCGYPQDSK
jgi:hypothetical protein